MGNSNRKAQRGPTGNSKLIPGAVFPDLSLESVRGGVGSLKGSGGPNMILIVLYRGMFCPFGVQNIQHIQSKIADLGAAGIDVVAVSADKREVTAEFVRLNSITFNVFSGLTEQQMRFLGLYVTDPLNYIAQGHPFCEPAYFLLLPDSTIKFIDIASHPTGGQVDVDKLIAGLKWQDSLATCQPAFKSVIFGSKSRVEEIRSSSEQVNGRRNSGRSLGRAVLVGAAVRRIPTRRR